MKGRQRGECKIWKLIRIQNSGPATGTRGLVVIASALEKPWPVFDSQRVSDFLFIPLRPFYYAAIEKRWKVQFRNGLRK